MPIPSFWKEVQKSNFTCIHALSDFLELDEVKRGEVLHKCAFPLYLPRRLAEKIKKNTLDDPILRQFVPLVAEQSQTKFFIKDPVGDCASARTPKYLQKYEGRVLLLTSGACAMHCRYCFRQNYSYASIQTGLNEEIQLIREDASLKEVILSGGDPLSLQNYQLRELLLNLEAIPHIKRLRFHTRFPIGIPERIDDEFLNLLKGCKLQIWFVIHCSHPIELDCDVLSALKKIQNLGIPVLNQCVLLKGVNDTLEILQALCEKLVDHGIFPYYLHQLDRVERAAHFEVDQNHGRQLIGELNKRLAGYGIPKYVQEIASEPSKTLL